VARQLLNAFPVLPDAILPPPPRGASVLLLVGLTAMIGAAVCFIAAVECGCHETSRRDMAIVETSEFSAFGAFHRAFCTRPGDQLVPMALQHDPWGTPYMFVCNSGGFTVVSAGEDGAFFTDDDIRSDR
jgi:hypothetical protein